VRRHLQQCLEAVAVPGAADNTGMHCLCGVLSVSCSHFICGGGGYCAGARPRGLGRHLDGARRECPIGKPKVGRRSHAFDPLCPLVCGGIAAGSWLWGTVAENYSTLALEVSDGALVMVAATGVLMPIRQWQDSDQDPFGFETPQLALDLKPRSGPLVVKIEYSIPEANVEAFLDRMQERRRVQSRVGARHWNLQRDLQDPSLWTETFRTPTWTICA
jgi:hypothetical protein